MAYLIPENIASRGDVRSVVQEVAGRFRDSMEDDITVCLDVNDIDGPLWIVHPDHGLLGVHVLDAGRRSFQKRLRERVGREVDLADLLSRAKDEADPVFKVLRGSRHLRREVPVRVAAALPNVPLKDFERSGTDLTTVLGKEDFGSDRLQTAVARLFGVGTFQMSLLEERVARLAIDPRIVIRDGYDEAISRSGIAFRAPGEGADADLAVLDRAQQRLAFHLGEGYRVIRGVAGSGKSLILAARARHLVEQDTSMRVLLTCYNVIIAAALAKEVSDLPSVEVRSLDSFAWRVQQDSRTRQPTGPDKFERTREVAATHLRSGRSSPNLKFDAVLVDEGQDFDPLMLDVAHGALADPDGGFVVVMDGVQNIYRRSGKAWRANGKSAQGRTTVLRVNYRNTHEILDLAYTLLERGQAQDAVGESAIQEDETIVRPEATSRRGPPARIISAVSPEAEVRVACDQIESWSRDEGVPWQDMLVLFGDQRKYQGKLYYECESRGIPYYCATFTQRNRRGIVDAGNVVRSASIMAAKGIEFPRVIVLGANNVSIGPESDEVDHRRLIYVAMTRATDHLTVTVSGNGRVASDLLELAR